MVVDPERIKMFVDPERIKMVVDPERIKMVVQTFVKYVVKIKKKILL